MYSPFNRKTLSLLIAGLFPLTASALTIPIAADTYINNTAQPKGKATALVLNKDSTGLLLFDLSTLPQNLSRDQLIKATLYVYIDKITGKQDATLNLALTQLAATETWTEAEANKDNFPPTLQNPAFTSVPITPTKQADHFLAIEMTEQVQSWVDGAAPNNGLALNLISNTSKSGRYHGKPPKAGGSSTKQAVYINTKETTGSSHPAFLEIVLGAQGAIGVTGAIGPAGPTGAIGPTGAKGDTGAIGATGDTGAKGDAGVTGAAGATGAKGDTGAIGATGATGAKGDKGATGAPGPAGPAGANAPLPPVCIGSLEVLHFDGTNWLCENFGN